VTLALAALLNVIPNSESGRDIWIGPPALEAAQNLMKSALDMVDDNADVTDRPISHNFHAEVPVHMEGTLTLFLGALFEYCHRGNLSKTRRNLASAVSSAMDLGLHDAGPNASEAVRRLWWLMA